MTERTVVINSAAIQALGGWLTIPNAVVERADLSFGAKVVYGKLIAYAWEKEFAFPAQERLARDLGLADERQVRRLLSELRDARLLSWHRRGQGRPNIYVVHLPDNSSGQDRTYVSGQSAPERTDASGLERTDVSAPSVEKKRGRIKEGPGLFDGAPDKSSGSCPSQQPAEKPKGEKVTWVTPYAQAWTAQYGGKMQVGKHLRGLSEAREQLGDDETLRRWRIYLASENGKFAAGTTFAATLGQWVQPRAGRTPPSMPSTASPTPLQGDSHAQPGTAADANGPDRWADFEARGRRQAERDGVLP